MADRRQQQPLRFRLPSWLAPAPLPSSPTPPNTQPRRPSTTTTTTRTPASAAARPSPRPPGRATQTSTPPPQASRTRPTPPPPPPPPPPARATDRSPVEQKPSPPRASNQTEPDPQPSTASRPARQKNSPPRAKTQPEDKPQPEPVGQKKSPPRAKTQPEDNPQPSTKLPPVGQQKSPPRAKTQVEDNPQPSTKSPPVNQQKSPPRGTTQFEDNPQPSTISPPRATSQLENNPQPPSVGLQRSPSRGTTRLQDNNPQPSSPSGVASSESELKPANEVIKQPSSPSSSQRASKSMEAPSFAFDKDKPVPASNSHNPSPGETNIERIEKTRLVEESSLQTKISTQKSFSFTKNHQMAPVTESDFKPELTKEVTKIEEPTHESNVPPSLASGSTKQIPMENQDSIGVKKMVKDNKTTTHQPRNKNIKGDEIPLPREIQDSLSKFLTRKNAGNPGFSTDEKSVTVITLAGENRGASMQLGSETSNKGKSLNIQRTYKLKPDEKPETTEENSKKTESNDQKTEEDQPSENYINNNIQGINNSIMFNSSITQGNPGVHLAQTRVSTKPVQTTADQENGSLETHKAEVNITPSQKHTYEPVVRRRCLRGLMLETSDSETDNPDKPRRHGCRVGCSPSNQSNNVDIL